MANTTLILFGFGVLMLLLTLGVPVVVSLGLTSVLGVGLLTGSSDVAISILSSTAFEALRDYVFAVIPLFILMGEFVARSGAALDLYNSINRLMRRVPGRLAVATVLGNAVFGAIVGVSVASAAAFSRIAYPAMCKAGYDKSVSLGCIAGSASLGMLIPPSILMIVWGVLTQQSISKLFLAGVLPGIALALMFALFCIVYAIIKPEAFGRKPELAGADAGTASRDADLPPLSKSELIGTGGCLVMIALVLGGIWSGMFTPTEGAGIGALLALVLALIKGVRWEGFVEVIRETGKAAAPIMCLLIFAQMYSRLLALSGVGGTVQTFVTGLNMDPGMVLLAMVLVWFVLGMFIDSVSIILLTVPIFVPLANSFGIDPYAFALIGILSIEAGIITPPFGLVVFTVKGCVNDPAVTLGQIFWGASPYWMMLLVLALIVYFVPPLATLLPAIL
ncbi:TRAP transporter large permease [Polaromonas sp. AET17H-212]|uniref:TRAP transporter large permease n=1 Tax=Polaromonas sp. AET17H-212 TaxID=1977061 RepID=UPI000BBBA694|nr:TRAP transporter large permease [Polaromonas sp. AET17H-212]